MLNDIKAPPLDIDGNDAPRPANRPAPRRADGVAYPTVPEPVDARVDSPTHASLHMAANVDRQEPGRHRARYLGERGATDAIYQMPMEDRGSNFSIGLTLGVGLVVVAMVIWVAWSFFR